MKLGDLFVKLSANTDDFKKGINDAEKSTSKFSASLKKIGGAIAGVFAVQKIIAFTRELSSIRSEATGVEKAFLRIGDASQLQRLRDATRGTVSDLELMKNAVQANNFGIPLQSLASLLEFASKRAQDTGQSVDYLVQSIVTGIGRKSPLILDNLGISAVKLQEALGGLDMGSASVEDVAIAVGKIADADLAKNGRLAEDYGTSVDKLSASWANFKLALSGALQSEEISSTLGSLTKLVAGATKYVSENITTIVGWGKVLGVVAGVLGVARVAQIAFNIAVASNPIGLIVTALIAVGTAVVTAYKSFDGFRAAIKYSAQIVWYYIYQMSQYIDEFSEKFVMTIVNLGKNIIAHWTAVFAGMLAVAKGKNPLTAYKETLKKNAVDIGDELSKISKKYEGFRNAMKKPVYSEILASEKAIGKTTTKPTTTSTTIPTSGGSGASGSAVEKIVRDASISALQQDQFGVKSTADLIDTTKLNESINQNFEKVKENYLQQQQELQQFIDQMNDMVSQGVANMVVAFADGFGQLLSGEIGIDEFANKILGQIGDFLKQIGSALIAYGIGMEAFKKAFTNPALAIGAGVALVALGSFISSKASAGPTASTSASGYSSAGYSSSSGVSTISGNVTFEIQGNRLVGVLNNENKANRYKG